MGPEHFLIDPLQFRLTLDRPAHQLVESTVNLLMQRSLASSPEASCRLTTWDRIAGSWSCAAL